MSVQLSMFSPPTLPDTDKCIASPDSAAGPTRSGSPDGLMIDPSGPEAAPASRSAWPGKAAAPMIRATFGLRGSGSSASASLQSSLVSKLQQQLPTDGSILWRMTWKVKATPSGRCVSRLQSSARGISGSGCGSWPSPKTPTGGANSQRAARGSGGPDLQEVALLASWPTPISQDAKHSGHAQCGPRNADKLVYSALMAPWPTARAEDSESTGAHRGTPDTLTSAARLTGWATPMAANADKESPRPNTPRAQLPWQASQVAGWETPAARDYKSESATDEYNAERWAHARGKPLSAEATQAPGPTSNGSTAATASAGRFRLNPLFSLWLMGYPPHAWASCAVRAMLSSRTSLRK